MKKDIQRVEESKSPVRDNGERRLEGGRQIARKLGHRRLARVEGGKIRVHSKAESGEEGNERNEAGVEQILLRHDVTQLRVNDGEHNGPGQVAVRLEEGDNLGTGGSDDEDVLRVAQDCVVEEDDEEHEAEGEELLAFRRRRHRRLQFGNKALGLLGDLAASAAVGGHAHGRRARRRDARRGARRRMPRRAQRGAGESGGVAARDDGRRREGWDGHGESRSVGGVGWLQAGRRRRDGGLCWMIWRRVGGDRTSTQ